MTSTNLTSIPNDSTSEIMRRAARVDAWFQEGMKLVGMVDLQRKDGSDLVRDAAWIIHAALLRRYPMATEMQVALRDVLNRACGIVTHERYVGTVEPGRGGGSDGVVPASCAEAGGRLDIHYALLAESNRAVKPKDSCPQRVWDLMYRTPLKEIGNFYKLCNLDIDCRGCGVKKGSDCSRPPIEKPSSSYLVGDA